MTMGNWFMPVSPAELTVAIIGKSGDLYRIRSTLEFRLSEDASALIDAGVPIQVRLLCRTESSQTTVTRTFRSDLANRAYLVIDSSGNRQIDRRSHTNLMAAARQFRQMNWEVDTGATRVDFSADVVPVTVPRLNRSVDISPLFGGKRFTRTLIIDRNGER